MARTRIMIIDDEEEFLKLTKANLEDTGMFEVATLESAKDLIAHLYNFKPDLILLDLLMPGIGGVEVCKILNEDPIGQTVPIIVVSALDKNADKYNAYKEGIVDYIVKPVEKNELIGRIQKALELKHGPQ
ncbi:MAG: response regulator [Candidatus Omnitrophota bacterium]